MGGEARGGLKWEGERARIGGQRAKQSKAEQGRARELDNSKRARPSLRSSTRTIGSALSCSSTPPPPPRPHSGPTVRPNATNFASSCSSSGKPLTFNVLSVALLGASVPALAAFFCLLLRCIEVSFVLQSRNKVDQNKGEESRAM